MTPADAPTYRDFGLQKLAGLVQGLGLDAELPAATRLFDLLTSTWQDLTLRGTPLWNSDITDDGTPFELSVAFVGGRPVIRVLAEAQRAPFNVESNWEAGLELTRKLGELPGVDLERFERIRSLFTPPSGASARFAIWHAGAVEPNGALSFKVYLNPGVVGPSLARELIRESLIRLDAEYAWDELAHKLDDTAELLYFSLDLSKSADTRLKVYVGHPHATSDQIDALVHDESGYRRGLARSWLEELTGSSGSFDARPILTCHSFRSPLDAAEVTVHVPTRCYVGNDAESLLRCRDLLGQHADTLRAGVEGMAGRPLDMGRGLVTYVSLRPGADGTRVTAYLAPEAHAISTPRQSTQAPATRDTVAPASLGAFSWAPKPPSGIRELGGKDRDEKDASFAMVERLIASSARTLSAHPLLRRLERPGTLEQMQVLAPRFTFYVLCFQDMLRVARELTTEPVLKDFAVTHEGEDRGHEQWFLNDLEALGAGRNLAWTFSAEHATTRDVSYRIMSEIVSATHDATRLAVLLSLEAIGAEFFGRVIGYLDRLGRSQGLAYFARSHQLVEQSHDLFEASSHSRLEAIEMPEGVLAEVVRAVTRTFEGMAVLGDDIDAKMAECEARSQLRAAG